MKEVEKRIDYLLNKLYYTFSYEEKIDIKDIGFAAASYKEKDEIPVDLKFSLYKNSTGWGGAPDKHYWFVFDIDVPTDYSSYALSVCTGYGVWHASNPQFIVYLDGEIVQGLDENHTEISFNKAGRQTVWLYAYTGSETSEKLNLSVSMFKVRRDVRKLFYNLYVLYEIVSVSDENSRAYKFNLTHIEKTLSMINFLSNKIDEREVKRALEYLDNNATGYFNSEATVYCVGQSHIDVEWLWTLRQTREKVQRSFSNVLKLLDKNKDATYLQSTPILYEYIKETQPKLYEKILELVKDGRWEAEGSLWVEADNVLSGGESLIRQFLYGKKYFKDEFGKDCKIIWLPDCFGFSGAFPQIAKKCGSEWFITSKISWNDTNQFPHDIFEWQGIDGTKINTYFLTTQAKQKNDYTPVTAYNGMANPKQIIGTYDRLTEKDLTDSVVTSFGWGDGGGGPTESMYYQLDFMKKGIVGLPKVKMSTLQEFIQKLEKDILNKELPKWIGELYLEYHRGTYTSIANVKAGNRKIETLLSNAEFLCAVNNDNSYKKEFDSIWKKLLIHQFHDALPGSSIKEVYDDIEKDFIEFENVLNSIIETQTGKIISENKLNGVAVVFNFNTTPSSGEICLGSKKYYVQDVPPKGYKVIDTNCSIKERNLVISDKCIENDFYKIIFNDNYEIIELFDKRIGRNIVKENGKFNILRAFDDINHSYDGWELSPKYADRCNENLIVTSCEVIEETNKYGFEITKIFRSSVIKQKIYLTNYSDLVYFDTCIDWKESNIILKSEFETDIISDNAVYNIQFGNIERSTLNNTTYQQAQFEVPFHKFFDLSEGNYGIALINDSKYGGYVKEGKMSLSLLKSSTYPYPEADKCIHKFSYVLAPHLGDFRQGDIVNKSYDFNNRLYVAKAKGEFLPAEKSFFNVDKNNVIIETVKLSEDGNGYVVRLYDSFNSKTSVKLSLPSIATKVYECDMLENEICLLAENVENLELRVNNYEIKTIKVIV